MMSVCISDLQSNYSDKENSGTLSICCGIRHKKRHVQMQQRQRDDCSL